MSTNLLASRTFTRAYLKLVPIHCGEIPRSWKAATVTPLHKSESHCDPNNFRPISVLPVVMKIFEHAIHKQLLRPSGLRISFYLNFNQDSDPVIEPVQPC